MIHPDMEYYAVITIKELSSHKKMRNLKRTLLGESSLFEKATNRMIPKI